MNRQGITRIILLILKEDVNVSIKFHGDGCWDISLWTTNVGVKKKWEGESTDVILREPWTSV